MTQDQHCGILIDERHSSDPLVILAPTTTLTTTTSAANSLNVPVLFQVTRNNVFNFLSNTDLTLVIT